MPFRLPDGGPVRVRTSNTASETPTPAELEEGEVALNAADGVLYFQATSGAVGPVGFQDAPENEIIYGRKDGEWVDITAPANLQVRRGTASEVAAITPLEGEPVWATDTKRLVLGDGSTAGGVPVGNGIIGAYATETLTVVPQYPADQYFVLSNFTDPDMLLVLPVPGAYYVKMSYRFAPESYIDEDDNVIYGEADLVVSMRDPTEEGANFSYLDVPDPQADLQSYVNIGWPLPAVRITGNYHWEREFVCVTTAANVTISPFWYPDASDLGEDEGDVDRFPSYSFAIQLS